MISTTMIVFDARIDMAVTMGTDSDDSTFSLPTTHRYVVSQNLGMLLPFVPTHTLLTALLLLLNT